MNQTPDDRSDESPEEIPGETPAQDLDLRAIEARWQERWAQERKTEPETGDAESGGAESHGAESGGAESGGAESHGAESGGTQAGAGTGPEATPGVSTGPEEGGAGAQHLYLLDMFPYPSVQGFSVNQLRGIVTTDVVARHREALGATVLRPIGWDSFGVNVEAEASEQGVTPEEVVERGIDTMRRQLREFGARVDWDREFRTSDPKFYRWTQWLFLKMVEREVAVRREMPIKWCGHCRMNLANEEALEGCCVHCGQPVEERRVQQWVLRITEYAERLHRGLGDLEWPQRVRSLQRNWIGRRSGYRLTLKASSEFHYEYEELTLFVRHLEHIPVATFLVLAPEHPLVERLCDELYVQEVSDYCARAPRLTERERLASVGAPDGRPTGAWALNPMTLRPMPIWVSTFVLPGDGFGAVLGAPSQNEHHKAFALKHQLPLTPPTRRDGRRGRRGRGRAGRGDDRGGGDRRRIHDLLTTRGAIEPHVHFNLRDWVFARQRFWGEPIPVVHCEACGIVPVPEQELPVRLPEVERIPAAVAGDSPLARVRGFADVDCPKCGDPARRDTDTMPQWAASCWYYLRYLSPQLEGGLFDTEEAQRWLPVDLCVGGIEHAILHLLYVRFFAYFVRDLELTDHEEPFRRVFNQGRFYLKRPSRDEQRDVHHRGDRIAAGPYLEEYGADALRLHLLFLGPPEDDVVWTDRGLSGCRRFLNRTWRAVTERARTGKFVSRRVLVEKHRLIRRVTRAVDSFRLNKAVSAFMGFVKTLRDPSFTPEEVDRATLKTLVVLLAPFAPHMAAELWELLDGEGSVFAQPWPEFSLELLKPAEVEVALLVNEHVRDRITIDAGLAKSVVLKQALARDAIRRSLGEREPYHVVWVQDRLLKILLKEAKKAQGPEAHPAAPHRPAPPGAALAPPRDPAS